MQKENSSVTAGEPGGIGFKCRSQETALDKKKQKYKTKTVFTCERRVEYKGSQSEEANKSLREKAESKKKQAEIQKSRTVTQGYKGWKAFFGALATMTLVPSSLIILERRQTSLQLTSSTLTPKLCRWTNSTAGQGGNSVFVMWGELFL